MNNLESLQREILEDNLRALEKQMVMALADLMAMSHKSTERIEDTFRENVILPLKNLTAAAENLEIYFKDKYFVGTK